MSEMVERVARAIFERHEGSDFDALPKHKSDWTENRGQFGGRFRDVNEPYQADYLDMAKAAIEAMREPNAKMFADIDDCIAADLPIGDIWRAGIDAALAIKQEKT